MASAKKRRKKVPDYGRPKRREIGFAQYVADWKEAKKAKKNNQYWLTIYFITNVDILHVTPLITLQK